jgi:hypothetical protein
MASRPKGWQVPPQKGCHGHPLCAAGGSQSPQLKQNGGHMEKKLTN